MNEFLYLYRGGSQPESREEGEQVMRKWITWLTELREKGHIVDSGQPLEATGKVVQGRQKQVTDGPYAETKDVIGGFSVIRANDIDHAVELAKGCPAFEGGGMVEIRPVMKMDG